MPVGSLDLNRARARQEKDRAVGRELRLDWIADTPFGVGGFGSVFMAKTSPSPSRRPGGAQSFLGSEYFIFSRKLALL